MSDSPNILFINTDQQTWDAISAYGNTWVKTPHIDRLVENGVSFMRSYCTDPVCAPARTSWMTGRYSSETGVPFNGGLLYDDIPDLGQILNAQGFPAYHAGKWHVTDRNVRDSFRCLYFGEREIGAGGAEFYDPATTHAVLDFLSRHEDEQPFYLQVVYVDPHDVCEYEHSHEYKTVPGPDILGFPTLDELPPLPQNFSYDPHEIMVQMAFRRGKKPLIHEPIMTAAADWSQEQWRFLRWQHYRFVEQVDHEIGLILQVLEASPFRDKTLIIFSVDHGEAAGCHQMIQKFTLYEESVRVPFIVASLSDTFGLAKGSRDTTHLVSGIDLLPTVLDYAQIEPTADLPGCSLRPLLEQQPVRWRNSVYLECNVWGRAIVTERYKYITEYYPAADEITVPGPAEERLGREQLFDLKTDPDETRNLADEPAKSVHLLNFRDELLQRESRLSRRPLLEKPAAIMKRWGRLLEEGWRQETTSTLE